MVLIGLVVLPLIAACAGVVTDPGPGGTVVGGTGGSLGGGTGGSGGTGGTGGSSEPSYPISNVGAIIVRLTNVERVKAGVAPLAANGALSHAAQLTTDQVIKLPPSQWGHVMPGTPYPNPSDRCAAAGYSYPTHCGENLEFEQGYATSDSALAQSMMDGWMASPGHRANLLSAQYTQMGAAATVSHDTAFAAQEFGNP